MTKIGKFAHVSKKKRIKRSGLRRRTCHLIKSAHISNDCETAILRTSTFMEDKSKRLSRQNRYVIGWNMSIT